ncbi:MAG: hypothetical protein PHS34_08960 [Candidatus Omnitrophica bacterium]|nr:hypothetical protein [Candidatus Omnitrophota bacterium]MDD5551376.1 hypothetical protein [Candidatus Omnitrophota bacterium]
MNPKEKFTVTDDKTGQKFLVEVIEEIVEKEKIDYRDILYKVNKSEYCYALKNHAVPNLDISRKIQAIIKIINTAWYLNNGIELPWDGHTNHYYFYYEASTEQLLISGVSYVRTMDVCFNSKELAEQALEILGEETIKTAIL